ncbi:MAG: hypothetical protein PWR27_2181, partial [Petroclostridium sp.]|nr:hypothetical protein [Petroclostridium sp.]
MRKCFKYLVFIFIISILLTGCHKRTLTLADDTWYIVDNNWILMLCEEAEQENYKSLVIQLKENGDVLNSVIEQLQEIERDAKTENALGVAYLRYQAIGTYTYYMIALANFNYVGNDVGIHYMKKALQLNQNTHQYKSVEANLYLELGNYYYNNSEDFDKALNCYNKCIEILENWQARDHYDLLFAYGRRGALYSFISQDQYKAIEDYEKALA